MSGFKVDAIDTKKKSNVQNQIERYRRLLPNVAHNNNVKGSVFTGYLTPASNSSSTASSLN